MDREIDPSANMVGQMAALRAFALAVADTHPFEQLSQLSLARIETSGLSDAAIRGFYLVSDDLLKLLRSRDRS